MGAPIWDPQENEQQPSAGRGDFAADESLAKENAWNKDVKQGQYDLVLAQTI